MLAVLSAQRLIPTLLRRVADELCVPYISTDTADKLFGHLRTANVSVLVVEAEILSPEHLLLCREISTRYPYTQILVAGGLPITKNIERQIAEAGVLSYIGEWDPLLLPAQVRLALRSRLPAAGCLELGQGCSLDTNNRVVVGHGTKTQLSDLECSLLACIVSKRGQPASYADLIKVGWGRASGVNRNTIYQPIHTLRECLRGYGLREALQTVHGKGYRYITPGSAHVYELSARWA